MSFSDWLSYLARHRGLIISVVVILAIAGLVWAHIVTPCCIDLARDAAHQNDEADRWSEQNSGCSDAQSWVIVGDGHQKQAPTTDEASKPPTKQECEDLKAQRRMAVATERLVLLTCYQFWLAVMGTAVVGLTLFFTARAAQAAGRSADVARAALVDLERPHVFVDVESKGIEVVPYFGSHEMKYERSGEFRYRWTNFGRTPAQLVDILFAFPRMPIKEIGQVPELPAAIASEEQSERTLPIGIVVAQDAPYSETENLLPRLADLYTDIGAPRRTGLFFMGRTRYRDIFNVVYVHGFCFYFDGVGQRWVRFGDERYNYTRRETPSAA